MKRKQKEQIIIECAMKFFSTKGFEATSIQEIVDACGMSKGTFYLYFKSKESLLMAIFYNYYELQTKTMNEIDKEDLLPRDKFKKTILIQFQDIQSHSDFISMYAKEQAIPLNSDIAIFLEKMHNEMNERYQNIMYLIYGKEIEPYIWDISMVLNGLFHAYMKPVIFDKDKIDLVRLADFILKRLDAMVMDILQKNEQPILTQPISMNIADFCTTNTLSKEELLQKLINVRNEYKEIPESDSIKVTLDVLKEEIEKDKPRVPVIQGMLGNFGDEKELVSLRKQILSFFKS